MLDKKQLNNVIIIILIGILLILVFMILMPVIISIIYGLLLAYILYPVKKIVSKKIKNDTISAFIVSIGFLIVFILIIILIITSLIGKTTVFYESFKNMDFKEIIMKILPTSLSSKLSDTIIGSINSYIANFVNSLGEQLKNFFLDLPNLLLQLIILILVFFLALKDGGKIVDNLKGLSPFKPETTDKIIKRFKEVTNSVLLGQILVGILQGIVCGIGYFIFGVPNIFLLIYVTMIVSLIPFAGHGLIWVPVDIYLFMIGRTNAGIGFLIYGLIVITSVENFSRPLFVSKRTQMNSGIVIVGMMGGLMSIGFSGLILGPLILAYVLLIFDIYKKEILEINPKLYN